MEKHFIVLIMACRKGKNSPWTAACVDTWGKKNQKAACVYAPEKNLLSMASEVENSRLNTSVISATYLLYGSQIVAHYYLATTPVMAWGSRPNTAVLPHARIVKQPCVTRLYFAIGAVLTLCSWNRQPAVGAARASSSQGEGRSKKERDGGIDGHLWNLIRLHLERSIC